MAAVALAGRPDPGVTEALLGRLTDQDSPVQSAAAEALAGRQEPEVTEALLANLTDRDRQVVYVAVRALGRSEFPEALMVLARKVRTLSQPLRLAVAEAAVQLMIGHYRRIDPADQPEVLAAMGWLTTASLTDRSA